jgi:hypothetical protein
MARGPFQGTYQQGIRPTVTMSPDALVYINGEADILGCSSCRRRFDWNRYITSIQTDGNIDNSPGSATINMTIPRHSVDEFYFDGNPLITPMMEIEIFSKGYYLVEGIPQYYQIFWGIVTEVGNSYSGGEHTVSIQCADILKWWELCMMNINPAFTEAVGQAGRSIFGNVFFGMNPYDIIWTLAQQSFGDVVVGTGSLTSLVNEKNPAFKNTFRSALGDIMQYWSQRFKKIRSNLLLYGTSGTAVRGDVLQAAYQNKKGQFGKPFASQLVRQANGNATAQMDFDPTDPGVTAFRTQFSQAGQVNFWQTEYQTKLELANAAKESIGFEFFMDVTGDIVFKPPFYNLDILSNKPVSWIQDIDIIDWDFSDSESEVVTQIQLQGNFSGAVDYGMPEEATPYTSVTDYHLLRKYGWRSRTYNSEFMSDPQLMFYTGLDMLDRYNSKRFRGTVNIPLRPELRLGFPVYIAPLDQMWYVQGISHNISYGGRAQTSLSLTAKRGKFIAPRGIGTLELTSYKGRKNETSSKLAVGEASTLTARQLASGGRFKATVGDAAQIPAVNAPQKPGDVDPYEPLILRHPKTGRIVGYPNVVMAYTRPFSATTDQLADISGQKRGSDPRVAQSRVKARNDAAKKELADLQQASFTNQPQDDLRNKHLNNRYSYGINSAGVYTYLHDTSEVILEMLVLPAANITFNQDVIKFSGQSGMIRPVSDERGFELIGHHRYGRGVYLRDGALINNNREQADIGVQLALAGGLYESLVAQSQGLTAVTSSYANPAEVVAHLSPEDLQTSAAINPDTKKPEFKNTETTFITSATLSSKERQGAVSPPDVEAAQLSRALTLAEMKVRENVLAGTTVDADCQCVTGRSDLAFINIGYQVQILRPTTSDDNLMAGAAEVIAKAKSAAAADPLVLDGTKTLAEATQSALAVYLEGASPDLTAEVNNQMSGGTSLEVGPVTHTLSNQAVVSKVDAYLSNLYKALDGPHQQYERELRGELTPMAGRTPSQVRFQDAASDLSPFAPPYSTPNRAAGGDPAALALQAKTALNNVSKAWSNFGDGLKANAERAQLQGQINQNKSHLATLDAQKKELETALSTGGVIVAPGGTTQDRLNSINSQIDQETQKLAQNTTKLGQLNQEFPP